MRLPFQPAYVVFLYPNSGCSGMTVPQLIRSHNYPVEEHKNIKTEDNYLLDLYRIPDRRGAQNGSSNKPPVLLMHGLFGSSKDFVLMGPSKGLAFLLADRDFDVWLGNARGTTSSRKHLKYNPDVHPEYWHFSWHEIGMYDLPAIFGQIQRVTGRKIFYIGISQGATAYYVLMSKRTELNSNVTLMVSLAPIAYTRKFFSPFVRLLAHLEPLWTPLSLATGVLEIPPKPLLDIFPMINAVFCNEKSIFIDICASVLFLTGGYDPQQLNKSILLPLFTEGPPSVSTRQLLHYAQNINSANFQHYDYGKRRNKKEYGMAQPPLYEVSKISSPIAIFYAEKDWFSHPSDVDRLYEDLPNSVYKHKVSHPNFNHYDFIYATDVVELVYEPLFQLLTKWKT